MDNSKMADLGILIDNALDLIEKENRSLNGYCQITTVPARILLAQNLENLWI